MPEYIKRLPTNGTFELTGRCNLKCKMCLVRVDSERIRELGIRERSASEWIDMARQAFDAGTIGLLLTGGEAMLRPDFCEIYEEIAKMGFLLTLYTNATLVTDEIMEVLRRYPPHKIGVTMYGACNKTYQELCGMPDGYDRFVHGIRQLSTLPSLLEFRTTIVKDNYADLPAMRNWVYEHFGKNRVLSISRAVWDSIRGGVCNPKECRLSPEENLNLTYSWLKDIQRREHYGDGLLKGQDKLILRKKKYQMPEEGSYLFQNCGAGIHQYSINWMGRMYPCEIADAGYTEPFEIGFRKAWDLLPEQVPKGKVIEQCLNCKYSAVCEACPGSRMAETGDWFGIPDYSCGEARAVFDILEDLNVIM